MTPREVSRLPDEDHDPSPKSDAPPGSKPDSTIDLRRLLRVLSQPYLWIMLLPQILVLTQVLLNELYIVSFPLFLRVV